MPKSHRKSAFTLAEVLITLGIIGIVAALVMPKVITSYQKKATVAALKANYSIFLQAIESSKRDNGEMSTWPEIGEISGYDFEQKYILPYLNNPQETNMHIVYAMQKSPSAEKKSQQSLYWFYKSTKHFYQLQNGAIFTTGTYPTGSERYIAVDINGKNRPNIMGKDVFMFNIGIRSYSASARNQLKPRGTSGSATVQKLTADSCKYETWGNCNFCEGNGYAGANCAALIAIEGWEITENYPW